jgi:putative ABC transport system permease protein
LVLRHGPWLTAAGVALGIGIALVLTRLMSALRFGAGPRDPMTDVVVSGTLATLALVATDYPARRAAHVDPVIALRADI